MREDNGRYPLADQRSHDQPVESNTRSPDDREPERGVRALVGPLSQVPLDVGEVRVRVSAARNPQVDQGNDCPHTS